MSDISSRSVTLGPEHFNAPLNTERFTVAVLRLRYAVGEQQDLLAGLKWDRTRAGYHAFRHDTQGQSRRFKGRDVSVRVYYVTRVPGAGIDEGSVLRVDFGKKEG